jgi:hypothetical protein
MTTYLEEEARNFTIREAQRLETQAIGAASAMEPQVADLIAIKARLEELESEVSKVRGVAHEAIAKAGAAEREWLSEAAKLATIRRQLEADRAAGKPFPIIITTT